MAPQPALLWEWQPQKVPRRLRIIEHHLHI